MDSKAERSYAKNTLIAWKEFKIVKRILMYFGNSHQIIYFMKLLSERTRSMTYQFMEQLLNSFREVARDYYIDLKDLQKFRDYTDINYHVSLAIFFV